MTAAPASGRVFKPDWAAWTAMAAVLIANAAFLSTVACNGFSNYDWGSFMSVAWRVMKGQRIYTDFIFHSAPFHIYMMAFFFWVFGVGKLALVIELVAVNTAVILAVFWATYRRMPFIFCVACVVLEMAGFYWIYPHPYYDYTGHLFGIAAFAVLSRRLPFGNEPGTFFTAFFCGVMAALAWMTKINIGAAYLGALGWIFLFGRDRLRALSGYLTGVIGGLFAVLLSIRSIVDFYDCLYNSSYAVSGRLERFIVVYAWIKNFFWVPIVVVPFAAWPYREKYRHWIMLCVWLGLISIFTVNTGSFRGWDYLPVSGLYLGMGFTVLFAALKENPPVEQKIKVWLGLVILTLILTYQGFQLMAQNIAVLKAVLTPSEDMYELKSTPLKGWVMGAADGHYLEDIADYINKNVPRNESMLIMSDLQVMDLLTGRDSYKGISHQWAPETLPAPGPQLVRVYENIMTHPPDWILTFRDGGKGHPINAYFEYLRIPFEFVRDNYEVWETWGPHALMRRRPI